MVRLTFILLIGTLLGIAAALTALMGVVSGLRDHIPDTRLVLPWPSVLAVAVSCRALALAASLVPPRLILRQSVFGGSTAE
jgi:putative ABC transport system permease protein